MNLYIYYQMVGFTLLILGFIFIQINYFLIGLITLLLSFILELYGFYGAFGMFEKRRTK